MVFMLPTSVTIETLFIPLKLPLCLDVVLNPLATPSQHPLNVFPLLFVLDAQDLVLELLSFPKCNHSLAGLILLLWL
jgi:hypothetical protein